MHPGCKNLAADNELCFDHRDTEPDFSHCSDPEFAQSWYRFNKMLAQEAKARTEAISNFKVRKTYTWGSPEVITNAEVVAVDKANKTITIRRKK